MSTHLKQNPPYPVEFNTKGREQFIQALIDDPECVVGYYESIQAEKSANQDAVYLGIRERGKDWAVWSYNSGSSHTLSLEGIFSSLKLAKTHCLEQAITIRKSCSEWLDGLKDDEWEERKPLGVERSGPFTFSDNTDFRAGLTLKNIEDVFEFFRKNPDLLLPDEPGSIYTCNLLDAESEPCWVEARYRGEMILVAIEG